MEVTFHRFVLAEFNTHRMFSRNSASSRAIPAHKLIERAQTDPAYPLVWPAEQKGMQGGEDLSMGAEGEVRYLWERQLAHAVYTAKELVRLGLHKSVVNRILEPFLWHTVIVTSTEWENFFRQRCSPLAQPEIRAAAELMEQEYRASTPKMVQFGRWHTPLIQADEWGWTDEKLCMVSAARCARVSHLTHEGVRDPAEDLSLFHRLVSADPGHWSPLEHVATPVDDHKYLQKGNLRGWAQLRHQFEPNLPG